MSRRSLVLGLSFALLGWLALVGCSKSDFRIEPDALPDGHIDVPYDFEVRVEGYDTDCSVRLSPGSSLPQGMFVEIGKRSIRLLGTPIEAGVFRLSVEAITGGGLVAGRQYLLRVTDELVIVTTSLGSGATSTQYTEAVTAAGGNALNYVWALDSGALPYGLSLIQGTPTALISGSPTLAGLYTFTLRVTDADFGSVTRSFEIRIGGVLTVTFPFPVVEPVVAQPYSLTLTVVGSTGGNIWYLETGMLPPGISLAPMGANTAQIAGTATSGGPYFFQVRVVDSSFNMGVAGFGWNVAGALDIADTSVPDGVVGVGYGYTLSATGGFGNPHTWSVVSGALPPGLSLQSAGTGNPLGTISGIPTASGTYSFTVQITDGGTGIDSQAFTMDVSPGAVQIVTTTLPSGAPNDPYSASITGSDGTASGYAWAVIGGSLPNGLTLAPNGTPSTTISGTPTQSGTFNFTVELTDSGSGTATRNLAITIYTPGTLVTICGTGTDGSGGDNGQATAAEVYNPQGVAVDAPGNVIIADTQNHKLRRISATTGIITTICGTGTQGYTGDGGQAALARLRAPRGLEIDAAGNIFVADSGNHVIRRIAPNGIITTVAGNGTMGYSGDGASALNAQFNAPSDVCVAPNGDLLIADSDNNVVRRVDAATGSVFHYAGDGTIVTSGDGGPATLAGIRVPLSVEMDSAGFVYIAEVYYYVRRVDAGGTITTIAGVAGGGSGGDGGPASQAALSYVGFLTIDAADNIFISDWGRVRKIDAATGVIDTVSAVGGSSFPIGLWCHTNGDLYIADTGGDRIYRLISP